MTGQMMSTGCAVRVVDRIPQDWVEAPYRIMELNLLACYEGKVGRVVIVDGCEEMPFVVQFTDGTQPMREMRFRAEEIAPI